MVSRMLGGLALSVAAACAASAQSPPPAALPNTTTPPALAKPAKELAPADQTAKPPAAAPATSGTAGAADILANPCAPANCCVPCCEPCGPPGRYWIDAGFIFWATSGQKVPPLVSTAPVGTPRDTAGALGQPGTTVLFPTSNLNAEYRPGFYINAGMWLDCCQTRGFEMNFFYLGTSNASYNAGSDGSAIITRPFFNTTLGRQDTQLVSFPGLLSGTTAVNSNTDVWGINPNFIRNCCCGPCGRFDMLLGFYYLSIRDTITINENLTSLPGQQNVAPGTQFLIEDRFSTANDFYGVNIGFAFERRFSYWFLGVRSGIALGVVHQSVDINGVTTIIPPGGAPVTYAGGLLAQPSNIGHYERDMFAVMPWVGVRFGCQVTERLRTYVGYDFFYLSNVLRAGEQIDTRVNTTQLAPRTAPVTGPLFPAYTPNSSGFIMHGFRIGAEFRF